MKEAIIAVASAVAFCACGQSGSKGRSDAGGAGGTTDAGGTIDAAGVCNVSIPAGTGDTCDVEPASDAGSPSDAGPAADLTKLGPYAVGHVNYMLSNVAAYARSVFVSVWYPAEAKTITSTTRAAQYPLDVWDNKLPVSTSTDWEAFGYDSAYEGIAPSGDGPFPLVMLSPGGGGSTWLYLYIGPRLASHGFVVAVIDHDRDGQYPWSSVDDLGVTLFDRTRDVSFAITELLHKNDTAGDSLYGVMDPSNIAMSGHSLGGYATLALAGGDDDVCDAPFFQGSAEPRFVCVASPADPRIKAIVALDPSSWGMRYHEMARISVPSLIIGETVEHSLSYGSGEVGEGARDNARPHAAINRVDSYRVDVTMANHIAFTNCTDGPKLMSSVGVDANTLSRIFGPNFNYSSVCESLGGFDPKTNPATHQIVTTYMLAFLKTYLGREDDSWMLTSSYARQQQPLVEFFDGEACKECPVADGEYSYRPHPCQCSVAKRDPAAYFIPLVLDGGAP